MLPAVPGETPIGFAFFNLVGICYIWAVPSSVVFALANATDFPIAFPGIMAGIDLPAHEASDVATDGFVRRLIATAVHLAYDVAVVFQVMGPVTAAADLPDAGALLLIVTLFATAPTDSFAHSDDMTFEATIQTSGILVLLMELLRAKGSS